MSLHCIVWCCMVLNCWLRHAGCISQDTYLLYKTSISFRWMQTEYLTCMYKRVIKRRCQRWLLIDCCRHNPLKCRLTFVSCDFYSGTLKFYFWGGTLKVRASPTTHLVLPRHPEALRLQSLVLTVVCTLEPNLFRLTMFAPLPALFSFATLDPPEDQ